MNAPNRSLQCEYVSGLLPWYINGTLDQDVRKQADVHLRECAACRQDFVAECQLAASLQERPAAPTRTPHAGWERLSAQLDEPAPAETDALALDALGRSAAAAPPRPWRRWLIPLAVGQAAVIALLGVVLVMQSREPDPVNTFTTVSAPDPTLVTGAELVRLAFDARPSAGEIERLTTTLGAQLIAGPTPNNVYTLALDATSQSGRTSASAIAWLRQQPGVALAEPVAAADHP